MIVLPPGLVSIKYPGYFFDLNERKLYSIKSGILRQVKKRKAFRNYPSRWIISNNGIRIPLSDKYLSNLKFPKMVEIFPMEKK